MRKSFDENKIFEPETVTSANDDMPVKSRWGDLILKIIALLGAFCIWLYAASMDDTTFTRDISGVQVQVLGSGVSGLTVISGNNYTMNVTVQGSRNAVNNLTTELIKAYVDVSDIAEPGRHTLAVTVDLPEDIMLVNKSLNGVQIYLDSSGTVTVPVVVRYANYMLGEGYELGKAQTNITEIQVEGPSDELAELGYAEAVLDLGMITNSVSATAELKLYNTDGSEVVNPYVEMKTRQVKVNVPLYMTKDIPLKVEYKHKLFNSSNAEVTIDPAVITVKGEPKTLANLDQILLATLDEKKLESNTITQAVNLPSGVENVYGIASATISITHMGTKTREFVVEGNQISVINPHELEYEIADEFVTVRLRGPETLLNSMTAENITAMLDLTNYANVSGKASYPLTIGIAGVNRIGIYELGEYKVTVTIIS